MQTTGNNVQALHSYRATLIPAGVNLADVHDMEDAGLLPVIRLKAANAGQAQAHARMVMGMQVLRIERIERAQGGPA